MVAVVWSDGLMISFDKVLVVFIRFAVILMLFVPVMSILALDFEGRLPIGGTYAFLSGYLYGLIERKWLD